VAAAAGALKPTALGRFRRYVFEVLRLRPYLEQPGDGRVRPRIPALALLWGMLAGQVLRECSHHAVEALVRSSARRALGVGRGFGDDTLGYFTERLAVAPLRQALAGVVRRAKRNKAFAGARRIGLALDGTVVGTCGAARCELCHPVRNAAGEVSGYRHPLSLISVVGVDLPLPCDLEPHPVGEGELAAGERLLDRAVAALGSRFADYVVADSLYANARFLHRVGDHGLRAIVRLKDNLPTLYRAAQQRFADTPAHQVFERDGDHIELWDAEDFDPWETLRWPTVRVMRYRQTRSDGTVCEAYWLTDWPIAQVGPRALFVLAKSRWEIENQGFNDAKNRYGLERLRHHHAASLPIA